MNPTELLLFDFPRFLQEYNIPHNTSGKNVSEGWIGVQCPFCSDSSNHLGFNVGSNLGSCWKCGWKGAVDKYIYKLYEIGVISKRSNGAKNDFKPSKIVLERFMGRGNSEIAPLGFEEHKNDLSKDRIDVLAPSAPPFSPSALGISKMQELHRSYLKSREFDPDEIEQIYHVEGFGPVGKYSYRLFIPFLQFGRPVTFTSRDCTGRHPVRYLHPSNEEVPVHPKQTLYNFQPLNDSAIVVEGPTSVWRLGRGVCATCGTKVSGSQIKLLTGLSRVFVMFDPEPEAQRLALRLCTYLQAFVPHVENLGIDAEDPAELPQDEIRTIRREIFGK